MSVHTTIEADPKGAVSFLRSIKHKDEIRFRPDEYVADWFTRSAEEVHERLERDSLWDNPSPVGIGLDYERLVGVNIGGNHPVIDDVRAYDRIVTSMKVIDTHAITYEHANAIMYRAIKYIDAFEEFMGVKTVDGFELPKDQIKGYHLEIAVRTDLTQEQREAFLKVQQYGQEKGVRVIIAEVA
ncbi:MAG: hypothetical protein NTY06_03485 [Candidatus Gottesmanbacteria bacterium]|nr:hypothetical protein [Candidatus Gottesmanbacteria bacterium]